VKPNNIVVSQPDYFMLADYGISTQKGQQLPQSTMEAKSPTEGYAAPESFDRYQKSDPSGDIFSLGATLYEMCGKTLPWGASGSQLLLKKELVPPLPEHYPAELNELLQACMAVDNAKRPTAGELHLIGKHFLETGHWNISGKENGEGKPIKRLLPYLLASAVFALLLIGAFWAYQNKHLGNPIVGLQKMATSVNQDQDEDVDEMLIAMLEEELEYMTRRNDSLNTILNGKQDLSLEENQDQLPNHKQVVASNPKPKSVASATKSSPKKDDRLHIEKQIEQQLNKVSDPEISGKARQAWKEETMAQFSEDAIRILEETEGTPKQYSPGIFLNLLMNVPHTIVVKEVKRDENQKVTELRLTMQPKT
jgi:serine/threonine protein kinase